MMRMTTMMTMAQPESCHDGHRFWSFGVLCGFFKRTFGRNMCQKFKGCDVDLCSMSCLAIWFVEICLGINWHQGQEVTHLDSSFSSQRRYSWQVHHYEMSLQAFWTSTIPTCPGLKATWIEFEQSQNWCHGGSPSSKSHGVVLQKLKIGSFQVP